MGSDTFCSLTGGCYYTNGNIVSCWISDARNSVPENDPLRVSDSILERLEYSPRDVQGSQDLVLLVPKNEDGELDIEDYEGPTPTMFSDSTVEAVVNFTIADDPDLSGFKIVFPDDPDAEDVDVSMYGGYNKFYIFLYAYRILIGRFPELEPHMIYATLASSECRWYKDEEYSHIADQYAWFWQVADVVKDEMEEPRDAGYGDNLRKWEYFWLKLLSAEGKSEDEIIRDAWFGKGRLYHFARADDFPKPEPFASFPAAGQSDTLFSKLPFDVLDYLCDTYLSIREASSLLCLNRSLRAALLPFINTFAQKAIARRHPYWLPIVAPCLRGDEEQLFWEQMWEGLGGEVPWAPYARECEKSPGMRNRQRIWGMAERFKDQIKAQGWLDGRTHA
ncbi:hypothetical protein BDZ89DRAFT_1059372 [Hymenopellis radicata]|nr:hypothetical protein BDZ89DRAFT_1059372 [Hymenopellis radicata]